MKRKGKKRGMIFFNLKYFVLHKICSIFAIYSSRIMDDQYKIPYLNAVIRTFGNRFNLTVQQSFRYLYNFKGIRFLLEYYDVEHTLSIEDTVDDLIKVCQKNGGELA